MEETAGTLLGVTGLVSLEPSGNLKQRIHLTEPASNTNRGQILKMI